jgi:hypothetical protein
VKINYNGLEPTFPVILPKLKGEKKIICNRKEIEGC